MVGSGPHPAVTLVLTGSPAAPEGAGPVLPKPGAAWVQGIGRGSQKRPVLTQVSRCEGRTEQAGAWLAGSLGRG